MAFTEIEIARYKKQLNAYVESVRPPASVRNKLDVGFLINGQSVEIIEIRPKWDNPSEKENNAVAKATYVKTQKLWKVYWLRADLKWHRYEPKPTAKSLEEFIAVVEVDEFSCFWG